MKHLAMLWQKSPVLDSGYVILSHCHQISTPNSRPGAEYLTFRPACLPSRSCMKVSALIHCVGGPVPFTVIAWTRALYPAERSRPAFNTYQPQYTYTHRYSSDAQRRVTVASRDAHCIHHMLTISVSDQSSLERNHFATTQPDTKKILSADGYMWKIQTYP